MKLHSYLHKIFQSIDQNNQRIVSLVGIIKTIYGTTRQAARSHSNNSHNNTRILKAIQV